MTSQEEQRRRLAKRWYVSFWISALLVVCLGLVSHEVLIVEGYGLIEQRHAAQAAAVARSIDRMRTEGDAAGVAAMKSELAATLDKLCTRKATLPPFGRSDRGSLVSFGNSRGRSLYEANEHLTLYLHAHPELHLRPCVYAALALPE